ncbi:MAG TPA: hypothetical protein PKE32_02755 [Miltoncostaeaceae bacterium]|mgnify:CR=1 FL=1|nr:hypothetical protein [Miltoncostaeaceae bacterium]
MISGRLTLFAAFLARRYGPRAVSALARAGTTWLADPANEAAKRQLIAQLQHWAQVAGPHAARTASRLAREVDRRRVSVGAWERDLMDLRYELPALERGPIRDGALRAYEAQVRAGVHLIAGARHPDRCREQVTAALRAEATMLRAERLGRGECERLLAAIDATIDTCRRMSLPGR